MMNPAQPPSRRIDNLTRAGLQRWETEGGATAVRVGATLSPGSGETVLLKRLGAAVVGEWNRLPRSLQRALYDRAVSVDGGRSDAAARRDMACFLHDHKSRPEGS